MSATLPRERRPWTSLGNIILTVDCDGDDPEVGVAASEAEAKRIAREHNMLISLLSVGHGLNCHCVECGYGL